MTTPNETPTPRTDAVARDVCGAADGQFWQARYVDAEFARQLERELSDMHNDRDAQIDAKMRLAKQCEVHEQSIERLRRELAQMTKCRDFCMVESSDLRKQCKEKDNVIALREHELAEAKSAHELCRTGREVENEDWCELTRRLSDIAIYTIGKDHPAYAKLNGLTMDLLGVAIHLCDAKMPSTYGKGAVRRLAEVEGVLAIAESERDAARAELVAANTQITALVGDAQFLRDNYSAAKAESAKWRECTETELAFYKFAVEKGQGTWPHPGYIKENDWHSYHACIRVLEGIIAKCHSPTPSSPASVPSRPLQLADNCAYCGRSLAGRNVYNFNYCSLECKHSDEQIQSGPPAQDSAHAESVRDAATASQLAELERVQDILRLRTEFLLEQFFNLKNCLAMEAYGNNSVSFKTAWPDDLALTESTSTSTATQKQSGSADVK